MLDEVEDEDNLYSDNISESTGDGMYELTEEERRQALSHLAEENSVGKAKPAGNKFTASAKWAT